MKKIINFIKKRNILIVLLLVIIVVVIASLYQTFASNSTIASSDETYAVTLTDSVSTVSVPAGSSKTIIYKINNNTEGTVKYGVGYSGSNITVKIYNDSKDPETGNINYNENKFVKLIITNSGGSDSTATILTVMGYVNGGNLIVPSGVTLVTEVYSNVKGAGFIKNLFKPDTTAVNNGITYNLDSVNNLMKDKAGNIRYYGAEVNNFIDIGDRYNDGGAPILYRIIGVFGDKIKVVRNEPIGEYSWDSSAGTVNNGWGINEWSQSDLMKLLNPGYENEDIGGSLWWSGGSGSCYVGENETTDGCDFISTGLFNTVKDKIAEVTWNLGGWNSSEAVYFDKIYEYERGTSVINSSLDGVTRSTSWKGRVALMYPSDYVFASDLSQCDADVNTFFETGGCADTNWMYMYMIGGYLLTPNNYDPSEVWVADVDAGITSETLFDPNRTYVHPTFYLNPNVRIESGSGTESNPYVAS